MTSRIPLTAVSAKGIACLMARWMGVAGLIAATGLCGCHQPAAPVSPTTVRVELPTAEDYDRLWSAARESLREDGYLAELVDRSQGRLSTRAVGSQHFFEFWRHDVETRYDWAEATLAPIRRRVDLTLPQPEESVTSTQLTLSVIKERLASPDRQFNESGALFQFFGYVLPSTTGQAQIRPEDDRWVEIGRDAAMEAYLLRRILARAAVSPVAPQGEAPAPQPEDEPAKHPEDEPVPQPVDEPAPPPHPEDGPAPTSQLAAPQEPPPIGERGS
ncbi:MAG: hypothetical protein IT449_16520 [Phycisphaerales bacterium]|nr:hypothetical protein [Phycisphaerales bacterium]